MLTKESIKEFKSTHTGVDFWSIFDSLTPELLATAEPFGGDGKYDISVYPEIANGEVPEIPEAVSLVNSITAGRSFKTREDAQTFIEENRVSLEPVEGYEEYEFVKTFDPLEYLAHRLHKADLNAYVEPSPEIEAIKASIKELYENRDVKAITTEELAVALVASLRAILKRNYSEN